MNGCGRRLRLPAGEAAGAKTRDACSQSDCGRPPPSLTSHPIAPPLQLVVLFAATLLPGVVRAADDAPRAPPVESQAALDSPDTERMATVLAGQYGNARLWYYGWSAFYGTVIVAETIINATSTGGSRLVAQVNIATSWVGLLQTLVLPPPVAFGWETVEKMPDGTPEARAAKSAAVRALFDAETKNEAFYHSAFNHIVGLAVNAGVCAFVYWGQHQGTRALINLVGGSLVWEANIFTYPNASSHLANELKGTSALHLQLVPLAFGTDGAGAALVGHF